MSSVNIKPLDGQHELNDDWIQKMLSIYFAKSIKLISWNINQPKCREGFLSEICFLELTYQNEMQYDIKSLELVLKFLPHDKELKQFVTNAGMHFREVAFYRITSNCTNFHTVVTGREVPVLPEAIYAECEEQLMTLVMRDLKVMGYRSIIVPNGSSKQQLSSALSAIAVIHSAGYIGQVCTENGCHLLKEFNNAFIDEFLIPNVETYATFMEESTSRSSENSLEFSNSECSLFTAGALLRSLLPYTQQWRTLPMLYPLKSTIIHGDFWAGQVLFSENQQSAVAFDWQFCHFGNPVCDIVSLLFMSGDPAVVEADLQELLLGYWLVFSETFITMNKEDQLPFDFETLKDNVDHLLMFGFMTLVASLHDFLGAANISEFRMKKIMEFVQKKGIIELFMEHL